MSNGSPEDGFFITVESDTFMTYDEIWPDGDIPVHPTAEDVLAAMKKDSRGNKWSMVSDWGLNEWAININGNNTGARWY